MRTSKGGFTIVEILVAMVVLGIGVVALVASSAMVTRMVGRGKTSTYAGQVAVRRLENMRSIAASTATPCTSANFVSGSASAVTGEYVSEQWVVAAGTTTATKKVTVYVTYKAPGGKTKIDTVSTIVPCVS